MNIMSFDLTVRIYVSDASVQAKTKHLLLANSWLQLS